MWKCCLVLIELQQHSHKFLKQTKKGCGIHWNWLRPNENTLFWKSAKWVSWISEWLSGRSGRCLFLSGLCRIFLLNLSAPVFKEEPKSAQTPQGNLCCLCNFEHNIWCLPKLASHRHSLFQSKPSMWRLIFRNPIKEALFKVLASPGEVMIPAMKSVGRTMGKTKSP